MRSFNRGKRIPRVSSHSASWLATFEALGRVPKKSYPLVMVSCTDGRNLPVDDPALRLWLNTRPRQQFSSVDHDRYVHAGAAHTGGWVVVGVAAVRGVPPIGAALGRCEAGGRVVGAVACH